MDFPDPKTWTDLLSPLTFLPHRYGISCWTLITVTGSVLLPFHHWTAQCWVGHCPHVLLPPLLRLACPGTAPHSCCSLTVTHEVHGSPHAECGRYSAGEKSITFQSGQTNPPGLQSPLCPQLHSLVSLMCEIPTNPAELLRGAGTCPRQVSTVVMLLFCLH